MTSTIAFQIETVEHPVLLSDWTRSLPKLSTEEVRLTNQAVAFAAGSESQQVIKLIESTLKECLGDQLPELSVRRGRSAVIGSQFDDSFDGQDHFGFGFALSSSDEPSYCFVETGFFKRLVDLAAGGAGRISTISQCLTPVEKTIAEIVSREMVERLFLAKSDLEPSRDWSGADGYTESLLFDQELTISLGHIQGNARVLINSSIFEIFELKQTPELAIPIPMNLLIGSSELFLHEIEDLEAGDIVLLTNITTRLTPEFTPEALTCLVGDAENVIVEFRRNPDSSWEIISLKHEKPMHEIQAAISSNELNDHNNQPNKLLDSVCVKLRIQLPTTNITGRQLMELHHGRILQLDFKPTDSVELLVAANNCQIATGKLVEIEGKLGVRIESVKNDIAAGNQDERNFGQTSEV